MTLDEFLELCLCSISCEIIGGLIKFGSYIDIFYAKTCATKNISTVAGYHVVLATLLFVDIFVLQLFSFSFFGQSAHINVMKFSLKIENTFCERP